MSRGKWNLRIYFFGFSKPCSPLAESGHITALGLYMARCLQRMVGGREDGRKSNLISL